LIPQDTNGSSDCYLFDRRTRAPTLLSAGADGRARGDRGDGCTISPDGRFAAFSTNYPFAYHDVDSKFDVYLREIATGRLTMLRAPRPGDRFATPGDFSPDGRHLTVMSFRKNLDRDLYLLDVSALTDTS
jgi:hypothetical protein